MDLEALRLFYMAGKDILFFKMFPLFKGIQMKRLRIVHSI